MIERMTPADIRRWLRWQDNNPDTSERIAQLETTLVKIITKQ